MNKEPIIMKSVLCISLIFAVFVISNANYCYIPLCDTGAHTMCRFTNATPSTYCGPRVSYVGLRQGESQEILQRHNSLRRFVAAGNETRGSPGPQPAAVSMPDLTWDDELAAIAQRWANQCNFSHDRCRNVQRYVVGQNVGIRWTTGPDNFKAVDVIQSWYDEVAIFNRSQVARFTDATGVGHYTQIVWAKTEKIGCGSIRYANGEWNVFYFVCNYGPSGNFYNSPVYEAR